MPELTQDTEFTYQVCIRDSVGKLAAVDDKTKRIRTETYSLQLYNSKNSGAWYLAG